MNRDEQVTVGKDNFSSIVLNANASLPLQGGASFSRKNRIFRFVWNVVWLVLCAWTPPPFHRFRIAILRIFGANVAWTAHVYGTARIWFPPHLTLGEHSCIGPGVTCYCIASIELAEYAIVSQGSHLCTGMHDIDDPEFQLTAKPIHIHQKAWIAAEAFIGPGVTIHEHAVIGARSVLFKDAEANGIYIGNPATLLRYRTAI